LYTTDKLEVHVRRTGINKYLVQLQNIDMPLPVDVATDNGTQRMFLNKKGVEVKSATLPQIDPDMFYLKKIIIE
jgi:hypothetical protein